MKRIVLSLLIIVLGIGTLSAQYKINKTKYDYKTWSYEEGDPYNPSKCGALSIIPGVGQMVADETGRGLAFLGGALGCFGFATAGFYVAWGPSEVLGSMMMIAGLGGLVAIDIWSIVDATRVAKVNNLAWRDSNRTGFNFKIEPYLAPVQAYGSAKTQFGLRLKMNF